MSSGHSVVERKLRHHFKRKKTACHRDKGDVYLKSSTYAGLVMIVFVNHRHEVSRSIESAIRATNALCAQLGLDDDLSHMTKYRIITELLQSRMLVAVHTKKCTKLRLAQKISEILP